MEMIEYTDLKPETCCTDDLKSCPFCGSKPIERCYPTFAIIECPSCKIHMIGHGPESDEQLVYKICWLNLRNKWNKRIT